MRLDELKWEKGTIWDTVRIPDWLIGRALRDEQGMADAGNYVFLDYRTQKLAYKNVEPIAAQAILYHITSGGSDEAA